MQPASKKVIKNLALTTLLTISSFYGSEQSKVEASVGIELRYFDPELTFKAKSDSIQYNGGDVDFKNDLGIQDKKAPGIRLYLGDSWRFDYTKIDYSGNTILQQSLEYEGTQYQVGMDIASKLDLTYARATWIRPITKSPVMETNWMIDIKGFSVDTEVSGTESGTGAHVTEKKKFSGAVPTFGFGIKGRLLDNVYGFAEISGLPLGKYGSFYDAEAGLKAQILPNTSLQAGYRVLNIDVKDPDTNEHGQFKLAGPFAALEHKF